MNTYIFNPLEPEKSKVFKYIDIPKKSGYYAPADVARIHDVYNNYTGTHGKMEHITPQDMVGVAVKETSLGQTKRGYGYNFDDSTKYAEDKAKHMEVGKQLAGKMLLERALGLQSGEVSNDEFTKLRDLGAGMHAMQQKDKLSDSTEEALFRWRGGKSKEPSYANDVSKIAATLNNILR